ncbi:MAG: betaine reductase, partial [Chloroflexi bacterium]|nr:betaine reductase [Chloroflexota bacterium]
MKLEIGSFHIREAAFGGRTQVTGSTLLIDKGALRRHILEDSHFRDVQLDLAKPG